VPQRPTTLPAPIPSWGNQTRPGLNNSGNINTGNINVNRPVIGGQRPNIGNNNNFVNNNFNNNQININTGNQFVNRPRWDIDPGFSRPAWGLGVNSWQARWHVNSVRFRFRWYNGCWHGHWGSAWYAPVAWVGVGWGLNSWATGWGGQPYFNPYYAQPAVAQQLAHDYSQSVTINNVNQVDESGQQVETPVTSAEEQALAAFDEGLELFRAGDYVRALARFNTALKDLPGDAVVHEVRSLALFAVGDYKAAAASLNSLLSAAPGMDWTTLSGLYGDVDDYTAQLRKLEDYLAVNPRDAAGQFVLAYHYLVLDSTEEAIVALKAVVEHQPRDVTAKRMLEELEPAPPAEEPAAEPAAPAERPAPAQGGVDNAGEPESAPETDLVGKWQAEAGGAKIELSISETAQFRWAAKADGQAGLELQGNIAGDSDGIELITADQGTLAGSVRSLGPDQWVFRINGSPPSDPGIRFARQE
jgi:tetratricopeptide (TPR) repeat protein